MRLARPSGWAGWWAVSGCSDQLSFSVWRADAMQTTKMTPADKTTAATPIAIKNISIAIALPSLISICLQQKLY
jgi:hypothetical protein